MLKRCLNGHRWCRRLRRGQRGIAALEYALIAPLLFAVLFVTIEVTFIMLADSQLDTAANRIARMGRIGIDGDCRQTVQAVLDDTLSPWVRTSRPSYIDVKIYRPGDNAPFPDWEEVDYQPECDDGARGDMVIYRLGFYRPGMTGFISWLGGDRIRFERVILIQNEP